MQHSRWQLILERDLSDSLNGGLIERGSLSDLRCQAIAPKGLTYLLAYGEFTRQGLIDSPTRDLIAGMTLVGSESRTVRSIFISDVHLGTQHCQAELLVDFLKAHDCERIYMVGDIIDAWRLEKTWYWPDTHETVVDTVLHKGRMGAELFYIPGNHDVFVHDFTDPLADHIHVAEEVIHETADGRRYLVIHGDSFDVVMQNAKWMAYLGDWFYELCLKSNTWLNILRKRMGLNYWSLGAFAKRHVKTFINIIGQYETVVAAAVRQRGVQGVICGHIHHAESRDMNGIHYVNSGDWVESCSAVVEHYDGTLEVIFWTELTHPRNLRSDIPASQVVDASAP